MEAPTENRYDAYRFLDRAINAWNYYIVHKKDAAVVGHSLPLHTWESPGTNQVSQVVCASRGRPGSAKLPTSGFGAYMTPFLKYATVYPKLPLGAWPGRVRYDSRERRKAGIRSSDEA